MAELNFRIVHVYGLTETYGPITVCPTQEGWQQLPVEQRAKLLARQGQAYPSADLVRVVDQDMHDIPQDAETMGEVVMRGNNVMSGYFADEAATEKAFRGGWFHSGDLAVWHPDGNIELRDRSKDIIISGGENISSIEVEQTISLIPAVLECAVIGIPHERWGERPKAFVTLNREASASADEIIAFCRQRLAHYKCPDAIEFGPLPKTSTGKVQKFALREQRVDWTRNSSRARRSPPQIAVRNGRKAPTPMAGATYGQLSSSRTSRSFCAKGSGWPGYPDSAPRKPPWWLGNTVAC